MSWIRVAVIANSALYRCSDSARVCWDELQSLFVLTVWHLGTNTPWHIWATKAVLCCRFLCNGAAQDLPSDFNSTTNLSVSSPPTTTRKKVRMSIDARHVIRVLAMTYILQDNPTIQELIPLIISLTVMITTMARYAHDLLSQVQVLSCSTQ
jgi:hypothetical protein